MSVTPGTRIGPYEVVDKLGEGGMGAVYRARDARLRRDVAIKVLPAIVASDPDRLARFEREGQALAALNHQHIAQIYGIESLDGTPCLVMELVEGATLAELLQRGHPEAESGSSRRGLKIDDAVNYAGQIAAALDAAHEKGIVHRDLKPANIKLSPEGEVKVLDFGLAKAMSPDPASGPVETASNSPTLTARATQLGLILGTGAYMSPEQARGKVVDKRADIWAFGCVLFELVTGTRAFEGDEITDVIARVIEREPDWARLPYDTPPALRKLLIRCLTKDPKARLRDIGEARHVLAELAGPPTTEPVPTASVSSVPSAPFPPRPSVSSVSRFLPWAVTFLAVIAAVAMGLTQASTSFGGSGSTSAPTAATRTELVLPPDVEIFGMPNISDNGRTVLFIGVREGVRQVWIRRLDRSEARPVPGTEGASAVAASPDGLTGAVIGTDTRLKRLVFDTNLVEPILSGADVLRGLCIAADGTIVFVRRTELVALAPGATTPRVLTALDAAAGELSLGFPALTSSGQNVLFHLRTTASGQAQAKIVMIPLAGGERRVVTDGLLGWAAFADRLVVARDNALLVSGFDERTGALMAPTARVPEDVMMSVLGTPTAAVSRDGSIVMAPGKLASAQLVWVDATGKETALPGPARVYQNPRLSPDGSRVAYAANGVIWTLEPVRGGLTRVSPDTGETSAGFPVWNADGTKIFYRTRDGLVEQRADGEGAVRKLANTVVNDYPSSVTPDGKTLVFLRISADTAGDLMTMPIEGGEPKAIVHTPAYEGAAQVSSNGKWMTYVSNDTGSMEVYLRPMAGGDRWPVSSGGGLHPLWDPGGRKIYYRAGQKLFEVDVTLEPEVRLGQARQILERRYEFGVNLTIPNYSISRDGKQFLFVKREPGNNYLTFVTNWVR